MTMGLNTALVLLSVISLGTSAGIMGVYVMLHKKTLMSDAVSHATLPGLALGYFIGIWLGLDEAHNLPLLLGFAAFTGYLSSLLIERIIKKTILPEDSAIAIGLSSFFALGIVLFGLIQSIDFGTNRSGLDRFLLGQTSGITMQDTLFITVTSLAVAILVLFHHKQFVFSGLDPVLFRHLHTKPDATLRMLTILMLVILCLGLKTTGAILVLALLIIPAATARLWSERNKVLVLLAALIGALGSAAGTLLSANLDDAPTGATITMVLFSAFIISLIIHYTALLSRSKRTQKVIGDI